MMQCVACDSGLSQQKRHIIDKIHPCDVSVVDSFLLMGRIS